MADTTRGGKKKTATIPRMPSVRDEIRGTVAACDVAARQLRDDMIVRETEIAVEILGNTVKSCGELWLCGNGPGWTLAVESAHKLMSKFGRVGTRTRADVLTLNGATATTSCGKCGIEEAMAVDLDNRGRRGDALWCFASDPTSRSLLGAVTTAYRSLKIPVVLFTTYPGTPLVRYADAKIRIQSNDDYDRSGFCVEWAHSFLANIIVNQLRRIARKHVDDRGR